MSDGRKRRSVLLGLLNDISFAVYLPGRWKTLKLTKPQIKELERILPSFAVISLFCTGIDTLARAEQKQRPSTGQNRAYFTNFLQRYLNLSPEEAKQLWALRNGVSHGYSLPKNHAAKKYGSPSVILKNPKGSWEFYLNAMCSTLRRLSRELHIKLSAESAVKKKATADYLKENGFYYVP